MDTICGDNEIDKQLRCNKKHDKKLQPKKADTRVKRREKN